MPTSNQTKVQLRPKYTKWLRIKPGKRTDLIFTGTQGQNYIFDVSTSKPRGQWLYSDFTMLIEMQYSTYVNLSFEEYHNYVDENGEVYIGLTTISTATKDLTMELSYNPEPVKPKPPVNPPVDTPVDTPVEPDLDG